jgi:hypothetical protein
MVSASQGTNPYEPVGLFPLFFGGSPSVLVIVFDDYAENIQQNQVKTIVFGRIFGFFSKKTRFLP